MRTQKLLGMLLVASFMVGCGVEEVGGVGEVEETASPSLGSETSAAFQTDLRLDDPFLHPRTDLLGSTIPRPKRPVHSVADGGLAPAEADAGAAPASADYDPGFQMATCSEWWVEVWASAASVAVEPEGGAPFALSPWNPGSFSANRYLKTGTMIRLVATRADGAQARTAAFAYLQGSPVLEGSTPPPAGADAGTAPAGADAGTAAPPPDAGSAPASGTQRLYTQGNRIYTEDGRVWAGRGANLQDTRGCDACTWQDANPAEVMRRADMLIDEWHADFVRITLESYASAGGRTHWSGVLTDASYLSDIKAIVDHIGEKPGVYVQLSLWIDPTFSASGLPTLATGEEWRRLAETFADSPHVLFGLVNEPENNYDGSQDAAVWSAMNQVVQIIRDVEDERGVPRHVVSVQGTGGWARFLSYYTTHPITAGGGENIAYEVHVYDPASAFQDRFVIPSQTLPVIIGEFGPVSWAGMELSDCSALMESAEQLQIPYLAWTFHQRCSPNLLVDYSSGGCGVGMQLVPTAWGQLLKDRLAQ